MPTITIEDFSVEYEYDPGERGSREARTGLQLDPDYPERIDIIDIRSPDVNELAPEDFERVKSKAIISILDGKYL